MFIIVYLVLINFANAQSAKHRPFVHPWMTIDIIPHWSKIYYSEPELIRGMPQEFWDWWWDVWVPWYEAKRRAAELKYIQSWNEAIGSGVWRLNGEPHEMGITPVNGALLFNVTDAVVPQRPGQFPIMRSYNSKIWFGDSDHAVYNGDTLRIDRVRGYSWLGMGWELHFGKLWEVHEDEYTNHILEMPGGQRVYFQGNLATNGTGAIIMGEGGAKVVESGDGMRMKYTQNIYGSPQYGDDSYIYAGRDDRPGW